MPEHYTDKAVRTRGQLEMIPTGSGRRTACAAPSATTSTSSRATKSRTSGNRAPPLGREGDRGHGLDRPGQDPQSRQPLVFIAIWGFLAPPDEKQERRHRARDDARGARSRGPEQLRRQDRERDGPVPRREPVRRPALVEPRALVRLGDQGGHVRGLGDGKKPKGAGWSLDASLKRDTGKWLQVMGRVRVPTAS